MERRSRGCAWLSVTLCPSEKRERTASVTGKGTIDDKLSIGLLALWLLVIVAADCWLLYLVLTGWLSALRIVLAQPWIIAGIWISYKALRRRITNTGSDKSFS